MDLFSVLNRMLGFRKAGGIISQYSGDQGDSAQRTGIFYALLKLTGSAFDDRYNDITEGYLLDIHQLEVEGELGLFRRSPDITRWYSLPENFSRDQAIGLKCAMLLVDDTERMTEFNNRYELREHTILGIKTYGWHQNQYPGWCVPGDKEYKMKTPDIKSPGERSLDMRLKKNWTTKDKIKANFWDFFMLFDGFLGKMNGWDYFNMSAIVMMTCNRLQPTYFSKLAWKRLDKEMVKNQIKNYYSLENNGIPPLGDLYCMVIDQES